MIRLFYLFLSHYTSLSQLQKLYFKRYYIYFEIFILKVLFLQKGPRTLELKQQDGLLHKSSDFGLYSRFSIGLDYFLGWTLNWARLAVVPLGCFSRLFISAAPLGCSSWLHLSATPVGWYSSQVGGCTCKSLRCQSQKQCDGFSDKITLTFFLC